MAEDNHITTETTGPAAASSGGPISVSVPKEDSAPAAAAMRDVHPPLPPATSRDLRADVEQILKAVKLPERRGPVAAELRDPAPTPTTPVSATVSSALEAPTAGTALVSSLHTLKDDMVRAVRVEKMSLVRAASLEQDRAARKEKEEETPGVKQRRRRTFGVVFASSLFVFLGIAAIGGVLFIASQHAPQRVPPPASSLIFAEQSIPFPIDGSSPGRLKQQIAEMLAISGGSLGSVARVAATISASSTEDAQATRPATAQEILTAIGAQPPDELLRALDEDFFFGIHTVDKNAPAFIFLVLSYEHAFAGMLAWEKTINAYLAPVFPLVSAYVKDKDGIPHERLFSDAVMRNYDARVLRDDAGEIVLYYSFPAPNLLIIAQSPYSFAEVLTRLRAQRRL